MTPEEILKNIRSCIRNEKDYNPMIHKWDLELFIKRYGVSPFLMYSMLKKDPLVKGFMDQGIIKFDRKHLKLEKPT